MKTWFCTQWGRVPPKHQRSLALALVALVILGIIYLAVSHSPEKKKAPSAAKTTRSILGQRTALDRFGVSRVSSRLDQVEKENKELRDKLERLDQAKPGTGANLGLLQAEIERRVQQELAKQQKSPESEDKKAADKKPPEKRPGEKKPPESQDDSARKSGAAGKERPGKGLKASDQKPGAPGGLVGTSGAKDIKVISASTEDQARMQVKDDKAKAGEPGTFLPSGSIFSGTLITGLDVSCGKSSKKDPFPVLLRVKKEAILPNMYRADVRECFLIAAGWGDLGSERAYLRGERLSCIREDGKAIETKIDMYAVGEDGKAGVRGRLVSKTGALLSKALMAGFMEGFSQLFTMSPVTTISTGRMGQSSTMPFQSYLSSEALQTAGLQGAGSALERLSNYYIDMAKDIFPVIEIDAGRAIDFVLISGISLKLQGQKPAAQ